MKFVQSEDRAGRRKRLRPKQRFVSAAFRPAVADGAFRLGRSADSHGVRSDQACGLAARIAELEGAVFRTCLTVEQCGRCRREGRRRFCGLLCV